MNLAAYLWPLACGVTFLMVCAIPAPAAKPSITEDQFQRLHTLIKPKAEDAKWEQIPWLSSLWEARKKAAAEGKPILLWEMDGNPLGCT